MADHQKRIALDSDKAKRVESISNENARLLANSEDILPQWIVDHSDEVLSLTGSLNFNEWSIEQKKIILDKIQTSELNRNLESFLNSNFHVAESYLLGHIIEDKTRISSDVKVIMPATVLYFFATSNVDPWAYDGLTDEHKKKLVRNFSHVGKFYEENKGEYKDSRGLVLALCKAEQVETRLISNIPQNYVSPNNKLANSLTRATRDPSDVIEIVTEVSKRGAKNKVTATCVLSYEGENVDIRGKQPFTEYDRNVYNAVVSLYIAGNSVFTSDMVWRTMNGKKEQEQPTPALKTAVTKSLDKMRFLHAQIDCSDEFKMRRIVMPDGNVVTGAGYDDNLLHLKKKWVCAGKNKVSAYEILSAPVLYEYSSAVKQVISVPIDLLDVKKLDKQGRPTTRSLEYTEQRTIIRGYLLRRIEGMKGMNALRNNRITLLDYRKDGEIHDGLYSIAGKPELSRPAPSGMTDAEKAKRKNDARYIREDADKILKYWKAVGHIKSFSVYKSGATIAGFEIMI